MAGTGLVITVYVPFVMLAYSTNYNACLFVQN